MEGKAKFVLYIRVQMLSLFTDRQVETHKGWIASQEKTEKGSGRSGERLDLLSPNHQLYQAAVPPFN